MLIKRKVRILFKEIILEVVELAKQMRTEVNTNGGKPEDNSFTGSKRMIGKMKLYLLVRVIVLKYKKLRSLSLQSPERGRLTEFDYLNGFIAGLAYQYGVQIPANGAMVGMIHEIEEGEENYRNC